MSEKCSPMTILLAEDDQDDYLLTVNALKEARLANDLHLVKDGEELMEYLQKRDKYENQGSCPRPGLIILDLNMPCKNGHETLREIKADPALRSIPVIILTTSKSEEDILSSYDLGANSYIRKPAKFDDFVEIIKAIGIYWFKIVELP